MNFRKILFTLMVLVGISRFALGADGGEAGAVSSSLSVVDYDLIRELKQLAAHSRTYYQFSGCKALRPKAEEMLAYLKEHGTKEDGDWFEAYLSVTPAPSPLVLLAVGIRTVQGELNPDEQQIFAHIPRWESLRRIVKSGSIETLAAALNSYDCWSVSRGSIAASCTQEVALYLQSQLAPIPYPLLGKAKLPIRELIGHMLNRVYPVCIPTPGSTHLAHGVRLSALGFALHDFYHAYHHNGIGPLLQHIISQASQCVEKGGDAKVFLEDYKEHALGRHTLMTEFFKAFLAEIDSLPLPERKHILAGWFLLLHEHPFLSEYIYTLHSLKAVLQKMTSLSILRLENTQMWESPWDPIVSSWSDGKSALEVEEIADKAIAEFLHNPSCVLPESYYKAEPEDKPNFLKSFIVNSRVETNPRFVDVHLRLRTGETKTYSFPTLLHKLKNMADSDAILKYAGVKDYRPREIASRKDALDALMFTSTQLVELIKYFGAAAEKFADRGWEGKYADFCEKL